MMDEYDDVIVYYGSRIIFMMYVGLILWWMNWTLDKYHDGWGIMLVVDDG